MCVCRLLRAEEAVLAAGGNVVRLAGLYHANRCVLLSPALRLQRLGLSMFTEQAADPTQLSVVPTCCRGVCAPWLTACCCRGAHTHFLRMGKVERWGGTVLNLLHYEDAASLCLAVRPAADSRGPHDVCTAVVGTAC